MGCTVTGAFATSAIWIDDGWVAPVVGVATAVTGGWVAVGPVAVTNGGGTGGWAPINRHRSAGNGPISVGTSAGCTASVWRTGEEETASDASSDCRCTGALPATVSTGAVADRNTGRGRRGAKISTLESVGRAVWVASSCRRTVSVMTGDGSAAVDAGKSGCTHSSVVAVGAKAVGADSRCTGQTASSASDCAGAVSGCVGAGHSVGATTVAPAAGWGAAARCTTAGAVTADGADDKASSPMSDGDCNCSSPDTEGGAAEFSTDGVPALIDVDSAGGGRLPAVMAAAWWPTTAVRLRWSIGGAVASPDTRGCTSTGGSDGATTLERTTLGAGGKGWPTRGSLMAVRRNAPRSACRWAATTGVRVTGAAAVGDGSGVETLSLAWALALRKADCKRDQVRSSIPSPDVVVGSACRCTADGCGCGDEAGAASCTPVTCPAAPGCTAGVTGVAAG